MRISPVRQILWTVAAAILLAVPLYQLTRPAKGGIGSLVSNDPPAPFVLTGCVMTVKCASVPQSLVIRYQGTVMFDLARTDSPDTTMEAELVIPDPNGDSVALTVEASWGPDSTGDQPMTITMEPDKLPARSVTRWSHGPNLNDLFSFTW